MRKQIILWGLLIAVLSVAETSAQIKIGVKGGLNLSNVAIKGTYDGYSINSRAGFFVGPTALIATPVKGLELDASLLFDQRGVETETPGLLPGPSYKTTTTRSQIAIPVNIRYNMISGNKATLFAFAGPQFDINVGKKENKLDYGDFVFNKSSFSVNAGIGLMIFQHVQIAANYNVVCGKDAGIWINRQLDTNDNRQVKKSRFNAWQFSIGYYF